MVKKMKITAFLLFVTLAITTGLVLSRNGGSGVEYEARAVLSVASAERLANKRPTGNVGERAGRLGTYVDWGIVAQESLDSFIGEAGGRRTWVRAFVEKGSSVEPNTNELARVFSTLSCRTIRGEAGGLEFSLQAPSRSLAISALEFICKLYVESVETSNASLKGKMLSPLEFKIARAMRQGEDVSALMAQKARAKEMYDKCRLMARVDVWPYVVEKNGNFLDRPLRALDHLKADGKAKRCVEFTEKEEPHVAP